MEAWSLHTRALMTMNIRIKHHHTITWTFHIMIDNHHNIMGEENRAILC